LHFDERKNAEERIFGGFFFSFFLSLLNSGGALSRSAGDATHGSCSRSPSQAASNFKAKTKQKERISERKKFFFF